MKLILLRHGQTFFNKMDYTQGWFDSPLTELGIQQATKARENLKDIHIDTCYCSISERAVDTAVIALGNRNIEINRDKRLKEMNFGIFEGNSNNLFRGVDRSLKELLDIGLKEFGGESKQEVINRELDLITEIEGKYHDETILLTGHGVSLYLLLKALSNDTVFELISGFRQLGNADAIMLEKCKTGYKAVKYFKAN